MSDTEEDESWAVLGPLGNGFRWLHKELPAILVAGGMGIAPLLFLAGSMAPVRYSFLAGFGSADQIIGADQVGLTGMEISIATDNGSAGHHGLVTELLEESLAGLNGEQGMVLACGPLPMLKAVAAITRERNIPCQVSLEAAMASEQDRAYWHVCQDGPVFDATDLDWGAL
jgi:dihydroorotate dehydrogenase electron transfer subunit